MRPCCCACCSAGPGASGHARRRDDARGSSWHTAPTAIVPLSGHGGGGVTFHPLAVAQVCPIPGSPRPGGRRPSIPGSRPRACGR
jgi:hypothetical protein